MGPYWSAGPYSSPGEPLMESSSLHVLAAQRPPLQSHTHHTQYIYQCWRLSRFSPAGATSRESSKAQLRRTGNIVISAGCKNSTVFKGKTEPLKFYIMCLWPWLRKTKKGHKAVQQRFSNPQKTWQDRPVFPVVLRVTATTLFHAIIKTGDVWITISMVRETGDLERFSLFCLLHLGCNHENTLYSFVYLTPGLFLI